MPTGFRAVFSLRTVADKAWRRPRFVLQGKGVGQSGGSFHDGVLLPKSGSWFSPCSLAKPAPSDAH